MNSTLRRILPLAYSRALPFIERQLVDTRKAGALHRRDDRPESGSRSKPGTDAPADLVSGDSNLVIAIDSGTARFCALRGSVLSIFGPSRYRRFAPFEAHNRVLTRDLSCSPCTRFNQHALNLCVSRECINTILPAAAFEAIWPPPGAPGVELRGYGNLKLVRGVSHLRGGTA